MSKETAMYEKVLYAAVGAPLVTAKKAQERLEGLRGRIRKEAKSLRKDARVRLDVWSTEGEKVVNRITSGKMVDEIAARMDLEQVQVQVSKLRDQLEDMLSTWRTSFRPVEKQAVKVAPAVADTVKAETPKTPAKKTAARKATAKKAPAKKAVTKKASPAKKAAVRRPATARA